MSGLTTEQREQLIQFHRAAMEKREAELAERDRRRDEILSRPTPVLPRWPGHGGMPAAD